MRQVATQHCLHPHNVMWTPGPRPVRVFARRPGVGAPWFAVALHASIGPLVVKQDFLKTALGLEASNFALTGRRQSTARHG